MILVDTSVWVDHLRQRDEALAEALAGRAVLVHPWVIGELALGNMANRDEVLQLLMRLPGVVPVSDAELLAVIDTYRLHGLGIGFVDVQLLATTLVNPRTLLGTRDRRLLRIAEQLDVAYRESTG